MKIFIKGKNNYGKLNIIKVFYVSFILTLFFQVYEGAYFNISYLLSDSDSKASYFDIIFGFIYSFIFIFMGGLIALKYKAHQFKNGQLIGKALSIALGVVLSVVPAIMITDYIISIEYKTMNEMSLYENKIDKISSSCPSVKKEKK